MCQMRKRGSWRGRCNRDRGEVCQNIFLSLFFVNNQHVTRFVQILFFEVGFYDSHFPYLSCHHVGLEHVPKVIMGQIIQSQSRLSNK